MTQQDTSREDGADFSIPIEAMRFIAERIAHHHTQLLGPEYEKLVQAHGKDEAEKRLYSLFPYSFECTAEGWNEGYGIDGVFEYDIVTATGDTVEEIICRQTPQGTVCEIKGAKEY